MRSTFWAGVVGVCLACCLSGLGCGDGEAAPGDTAGGEGAGEASCSGLDPSTVVGELTPEESEQACEGYRRCSLESVTVEFVCHMIGVMGAKFGDDPGTTDAELRVRCAEQYQSCMADPSQAEVLIEQTIARVEARPCVQSTQCTATVAELEACFSATRERSRNVLPGCSELTLAFYEGPAPVDDATAAACGAITPDCWQLAMPPEE
ncbi:hypothetical protein [Sorangium sp. So ce176]|uniref:hypothetical protein n=1 Tax=Sorangium sp. So ce176 TaxID=3133286 RepID=UPI003F5E4F49